MRWVYWERPALPGSRWEGERVQSRGNGSQPSQVERVLTYPTHYTYYTHYTHVRVLPAHTDRLQKNMASAELVSGRSLSPAGAADFSQGIHPPGRKM